MSGEMLGRGCSAKILNRTELRYREGDGTVLISGEALLGENDFSLYVPSIHHWEGSGVVIDDAQRAEIVANIQEAFHLNGLKLVVD